MGILITLEQATKGMRDAANRSGAYTWPYNGERFPRIQVVTVEQLLEGERPKMPPPLTPYVQAQVLVHPPDRDQHDLDF